MIPLSEFFLAAVVQVAKRAGDAVMPIYLRPRAEVATQNKHDGSPLSEADLLAHRLILADLAALAPQLPCLSEESAVIPYAERALWDSFWLIDPIDGTKEFLAQNGDFTVNIALIHQHRTILGVVYAPATQSCYFAAEGLGAFSQMAAAAALPLAVRPVPLVPTIAVSRRHGKPELNELLSIYPEHHVCHRGSSVKFCLIAAGEVDAYPRRAPTSEWDTAAAQCVLEQAGGHVVDFTGSALRYNTRDTLLNPYFVAYGDASVPWLRYFQPTSVCD